MAFALKRNGDSLLVSLEDRLDIISVPELDEALDKALKGVSGVTFDLDRLEYISSAGLRMLLSCYKLLENCGGKVRLINAKGDVRRVLNETGFAQIFKDE